MDIPLQITARDIELTDAIRAEITEKAEKLDNFYDRITRCRVAVECPKRHPHEGKLYNVHIYMTVPGAELVVKRAPNEDLYVSVRDAFQAARRKLEDYVREQRGDIKRHEEPPTGRISRIFQDKGYGFITTPDGLDVYFHEHSVLNLKFRQLEIGMEVRFAKEEGEKGPQASSVTVL
ncbi:MAG: HPF/RaiA family ribosome-associated protein [Nitrospirae bacterium]|nr:HPF/RaiA family ribosome-associated protein [Nitrospirota bacterium]